MTFWDLCTMEATLVCATFKIFESLWTGMEHFVHEVKSYKAEIKLPFLSE